MNHQGKELIFVSQIKRDGSGTKLVKKYLVLLMQNDYFVVTCLSIRHKTYIASGFNSFVVKFKADQE